LQSKAFFLILDLNVSGSSEIIVSCVFVEVCFWWDFYAECELLWWINCDSWV